MYSQSNEEDYILSAVASEPSRVLLDIGAHDGAFCSNSLRLIEMGWGGVLVEPAPAGFSALLARHGRNPNLTLVQSLVMPHPGLYDFWVTPDAVSTTELPRYELWRDTAAFNGHYYASAVTIDQLMQKFPVLDNLAMVSIDTEGTSPELFRIFPFHRVTPKCFVVEYDKAEDDIMAIAKLHGYHCVCKSNENLVLVRL